MCVARMWLLANKYHIQFLCCSIVIVDVIITTVISSIKKVLCIGYVTNNFAQEYSIGELFKNRPDDSVFKIGFCFLTKIDDYDEIYSLAD